MLRSFLIIVVVLLSSGWSFNSGWDPGQIPASSISSDTTNFDNNLSTADDTVQKALETLDELIGGEGGSSAGNLDGGNATSTYGAITPIDGGGA